jgi:uncharacterized phage protein gp47/JayE
MITIPTLNALYTQILADLEAEFNITIPLFGKNFLRALAAVQAAKLKLFYLAVGNIQKNIFCDTADPEASGGTLERFGRVKLNRNPFPAVAGQYTVAVTGTISSVIPAQTTFKSDDTSTSPGYLFILDSAYTLTATTDYITLRALTAGEDAVLVATDTLTATAPIAGVNSAAAISAIVVAAEDAETIEEYRAEVLAAYRLEPQGGAATDYRLWASDAVGVRQTYPYAKTGESNVIDLYVEGNTANGVPSAGVLAQVEAVVELDPDTSKPLNERGRRPLGVLQVNYLDVVPLSVNITVNDFVGTEEQKENIDNAIADALDAIRPFVSGADIVADRNDTLSETRMSFYIQDAEPTVSFSSVDITVNGVAQTSYQFTMGDIPYYNSLTWN